MRKSVKEIADKGYIVFLVLINLGIIVILLGMGYTRFATDDDFFMMIQASGAYGEYSPYLLNSIHSNVVFGYILVFLSKCFPTYNWMTLIYFLSVIIGESVIEYYLVKNNGIKKLIFSCGVSILLIPYLLAGINYTKIAGMLTISSIILCYSKLNDERRGIKRLVFGLLLFFFAFVIRSQAALFALPFTIVLFVKFVRENTLSKEHIKRWVVPILVYGVMILILSSVNNYAYSRNANINRLNEREKLLVELRDFGIPSYEEFENEYRELGISETDIEMLSKCYYLDKEVFSDDVLQRIIQLKSENSMGVREKFHNALSLFPSEVFRYPLMIVALVSTFLCVFISKADIEIVLATAISFAEIFYLMLSGRYPIRVLYIPMLGLFVFSFLCADIDFSLYRRKTYIGLTIMMLFAFLNSGLFKGDFGGYGYRKSELTELLDEANSSNKLYIVDSTILFEPYSPVKIPDYNEWKNIAVDTGWVVDTIANENKIRSFANDANIYKLSTKENILFVGKKNIDLKLKYIQEHYFRQVSYELVDVIGDEEIYRFVDSESGIK